MDDKIWLVAEEEPVDERDPLDVVNEIYERLGLPAHAEGIPHDPAAHWNKIKRGEK